MSIVPVDTSSEVAVTDYLTRARDWLHQAVENTGPEQIAAAKAEIATAAEATKQLGLSKEIQLDAQEMVRRAEYALGRAIRKGQAEGTVAPRGGDAQTKVRMKDSGEWSAPTDFASRPELYGNHSNGILSLADDAVTAEDFDAAIEEAKAEGNLSRANVARKAREKSGRPLTERNFQEAELVSAFRSTLRPLLSPKNVATLSPKARALLIDLLNNAIGTLEGTDK